MRLVLLGPPGAGKGTQASIMCRDYGIAHISTGEMLREAVASGSELGMKVKATLDTGDLVADAIVLEIIKERISRPDCHPGFLLDGFPRTVAQAEGLRALLGDLRKPLTKVVALAVPEDVILQRIALRGAGAGSDRTDDSVEVAAHRLRVYREQTAPLVAYYRSTGDLAEVNGDGSVEGVCDRIKRALVA